MTNSMEHSTRQKAPQHAGLLSSSLSSSTKPQSAADWAYMYSVQSECFSQSTYRSEQTFSTTEHPQQLSTTCRLVLGNQALERKTKEKRVGSLERNTSITRSISDGNSDESVRYLTRHNIDKTRQTHGLCLEVLYDDCLPCCDSEARHERSSGADIGLWMMWSIIRSELFIYSMHVISTVIGAVKEGITLRRDAPQLALFSTCVETAATLLLVLVRMGNAYAAYRAARSTVRHDENFDPDKDPHIKQLRRWLIAFEVIGLLLFAFPLISLIVFHLIVHTGWTILSNNITMITILTMSTMYSSRVILTVSRIREDQYKVVIHEAAALIEEAHEVIKRKSLSTNDADDSFEASKLSNAMNFVRAIRSTKLLQRPGYIKIAHHTSDHDDSFAHVLTNNSASEMQ